MNVLCSFLTIYALLCSNVVVHLSDHNRVMVAQVDYHNLDPVCTTIGDLKARLLRLAFPALDDSYGQSSSKSGVVGEKELAAGIAKLKLFIKGNKIDDPLDTQLNCSKIKSGMKLTMVISKQ